MREFAFYGYAIAAGAYGLLAVLLMTSWRARFQGVHMLLATGATALWAMSAALHTGYDLPLPLAWAAEVLRNLLWMLFLLRLLLPLAEGNVFYSRLLGYVRVSVLTLALLMLFVLAELPVIGDYLPSASLQREFSLLGQLLFAVLGLALVEQLFRNTPEEQRWGIKYLCFGLGVLFVYDFYLYTDALLFRRLDPEIWSARGMVQAMAVPMLAVTAARNPNWSLGVFVSRRMVFHSTTLFGAGLYMLLMALAGYYIKLYGGAWGTVLQITFLFAAVIVLMMLVFSGQLRARVKVFFYKHFFDYRYDYREEWLRLIGLLTGRRTDMPLYERTIWAISEIVDSPGGFLWLCNEKGEYRNVARFNFRGLALDRLDAGEPILEFLKTKQWVLDLDEYRESPEIYDDTPFPPWLVADREAWLIVPLAHDQKLIGFVLLMQPRAPQMLNWENRDLLKTAGMQAASYIAQDQAALALAEARQFEGFNRLSAFVIHDLKNLIAQLSLVARNAEKHKHNPEFIDDAVRTLNNAVSKMNRLMTQLKSADASGRSQRIELVGELRDLIRARSGATPEPTFKSEVDKAYILAEEDRLVSVIGHVLQNAIDATGAEGSVSLHLRTSGDQAIVDVRDTGTGMDEEFIKTRLFRPFDSTKGLTGMGIGAYECREVVQAMGGQVVVDSAPGKGTSFRIMLPLAANAV